MPDHSQAYHHITVKPLSGALGAEVLGPDLATLPDPRVIAEIRQAFHRHSVIFFRDQTLTPGAFERFARCLGELDPHHLLKGLEDNPAILEIRREPDDREIFAPGWHADVTYQESPVLGALLYALEVPAVGGDTLFASQALAYDALSPGLRALLDGLVAVHGTAKVYGAEARKYTNLKALTIDQAEAAKVECEHPVVRRHPETGRKALFVNPHYTLRFKDMTAEESRPLLRFLFAHATRPEFTCRFRWEKGSIAFWDNRCTLHSPIDDYFGQRRHMWRITLAGDRPV